MKVIFVFKKLYIKCNKIVIHDTHRGCHDRRLLNKVKPSGLTNCLVY